MTKEKHFLLNDGHYIPAIGLGTVGIQGGKGVMKSFQRLKQGTVSLTPQPITIMKEW